MNYYAQGGLHRTSHYLKSKGRGNDTELVHMTPGEIKGLQALALAHGGSLTTNPDTGLPEAGFLEDILPVVAAAGLTYLTAGAATPMLMGAGLGATSAGIVAGAGAGAAISGGMAAIQGKDVGQAALMGGLGGGVSGGLGAYADANVFGVGATPLPDAGAQAVAQTGTQAATQTAATGVNATGNTVSMANPAGTGFINPETGQAIAAPLNPYATQAGMNAAALPEGAARNTALNQLTQNTRTYAEGATQLQGQGLSTAPPNTFYQDQGTIGRMGIQALPVATLLEDKQSVPGYQEDEYTRRLKGYKLSPDYQPYVAPRPNPYYRPSYAAEGGVMSSFDDEAGVDMAEGGKILMPKLKSDFGIATDSDPSTRSLNALDATELRNKKLKSRFGIKTAQAPKTGIKSLGGDFSDTAAKGGIADLGGYSDGGRMLKGPGDGMSDSIPGVIGGKQPARLADGEFVVPADVVSHLGNGSTDAGAKKLYGMMDKIRHARTGKKKQAPQVNVDKYLPIKKADGGMAGYAEGGIVGYAEGGIARYNTGGPSFSDAQVASYFQGNAATPAQQAEAMAIFGVSQAQADRANALIASGSSSIGDATAAYNAAIAANPSQAAANAQFVASQQAALAAGQPTYVSTLAPKPVTPTPVTPTPVNINTTGPGGYTIPTFPPEAIASYIKEHKVTTPAQLAQLQYIFNVSNTQLAAAQSLLRNNDPIVDATTAKYRADIAKNPAQEAQNARDLQARMTQLNITTPLIPLVPPPVVPPPVTPVTPESTTTTGPLAGSSVYRPGFVPRTSGVTMSDAIKDPYSNQGLESLYSQMMGQYAKPAAPMSNAEVKALAERAYSSGSGAEVGRALINAGIPVNQAISSLKSYAGLTPDIVNQAYIGGQSLGVAPPPTLNTQYNYSDPATYYRPPAPNNLILTKPIVDAAFTPTPANTGFFTAPSGQIFANEAAYNTANPAPAPVANKAGGLLSIDRKKRAKPKYKT